MGIKAQYRCDEGFLQLALKDRTGNAIATLEGYDCGGYAKLAKELEHYLTTEDGLYVEVLNSAEGIANLTVTIEFMYDNR